MSRAVCGTGIPPMARNASLVESVAVRSQKLMTSPTFLIWLSGGAKFLAKLLPLGAATLLLVASVIAQPQSKDEKDKKSSEDLTTKVRLVVTAGEANKPVGNASVYIRYPREGGLLHRSKDVEMNFKTNLDGRVKVPDLPRRKILIQVVAEGWKTFGKWYELDKDEETIEIKLEKPPHWY
jgi:hypothetical protein